MARVCARRAAGIVVGEYLRRTGNMDKMSNSALERLSVFNRLPEVDEETKQIGQHFLMKVNQDHELDAGIDLIEDAMWLKDNLLRVE